MKHAGAKDNVAPDDILVTIQVSIDFPGITCMTGKVLAEWGRGPISSFAAILSGKIWKHVKNNADSKGAGMSAIR